MRMSQRELSPGRGIALHLGLPAIGIAGLMLGQPTADHPLRLVAFVVGAAAVTAIWIDLLRDYLGSWREGGVEHHTMERAGFLTLCLGIVALLVLGVALHVTDSSYPDPLNIASALVVAYLLLDLFLRERLT